MLYEAPHKLLGTLEQILQTLGNRQIVLARELTKIHEEFIRGTCMEVLRNIKEPKGEYVILIEGAEKNKDQEKIENLSNLSLEEHYKYYEEKQMNKKEIIKQIAKDRGVQKNDVYKYFV